MKQYPFFKIPKTAILHPKNLDWEKAKRWGELIFDQDGYKAYVWKGKFYWFDGEVRDEKI